MPRVFIQILWLLYSVAFAYVAVKAAEDDVQLGYPIFFTVPAALCNVIVVCGIALHALNFRSSSLAAIWRRVFPILVALPLIGIAMDAIVPTDYSLRTHGIVWTVKTAIIVMLIGPAYYANFRLAYRSA
jgi:hypothetical protein